jgi:hypothetical protein
MATEIEGRILNGDIQLTVTEDAEAKALYILTPDQAIEFAAGLILLSEDAKNL